MPRAYLSSSFMNELKPDQKRQVDYHDQHTIGLAVRISPAGKKTFCVFYRVGRRLRRYSIGTYPAMSVDAARERASQVLRSASAGCDPADESRTATVESFGELARVYLEKHAVKKRSGAEDRRIVARYLLPAFGDTEVGHIRRDEIRDMLAEIAADAPVMANRVLACVRKIFNWGIANEYVKRNPCTLLAPPGEEVRRERVYSDDELKRIWKAADGEAWVAADLIRLQLLTGQRVGDLMEMRWREVRDRWWVVPAVRSRTRTAHSVWCSDPAVRILERIRKTQRGRRGNRSGWVFPGRRPDRPIESVRSVQNRLRTNAAIGDFRPQDIPRTVGMRLGAEGVPRLTIAKVLNHADPELASAYDRSGRDPEKQKALDAWGRRLMMIVSDREECDVRV